MTGMVFHTVVMVYRVVSLVEVGPFYVINSRGPREYDCVLCFIFEISGFYFLLGWQIVHVSVVHVSRVYCRDPGPLIQVS